MYRIIAYILEHRIEAKYYFIGEASVAIKPEFIFVSPSVNY